VNALDDSGRNALSVALCRNGDTSLHQALLDRGARVAANALHDAADVTQNNAAVLAWVMAQGVDIDARDESGETALHKAVTSHSTANVKALLAKGADASLPDEDGRTPYDLAIEYENDADRGAPGQGRCCGDAETKASDATKAKKPATEKAKAKKPATEKAKAKKTAK
jgi:ankyrin repeat protein